MPGEVVPFPQAPDGVEIRHLRAFVAVAEELNFGRAAARLYVSQPALSRQIRALERLLGCELLRRSTHRVELTVAGSALLDRARRLLGDLDEAIAATQSVGGELANRMATLWAPVLEVVAADRDIQETRAAYEGLLAQVPMPDDIQVRPALAGGVSSLEVAAGSELGTAILYLHGGGYIVGSSYGYRQLVGALVAAAGVDALVPDFRLAPEHPFPAALEDALSAYRWLGEQGVPPERVVVAGDSAGGGLVMSLLLTLKRAREPYPGAAILLCPFLDLSLRHTNRPAAAGPRPAPMTTAVEVIRCTEAYLNGHPSDDPIVDPLAADLAGLPPMLIQAATGDGRRADAEMLAARAQEQGVAVRLELYPVDAHAFQLFWSFLPEAADALQQAGGFIRERLDGGSAARRAAVGD
jgi:epsilon-lactone hydrolase